MSTQMVTANRLTDGMVVYLTKGGDWATQFTAGAIFADQTDVDTAMAEADRAASQQKIVGPYLIDVLVEGDIAQPTSTRERIRADRKPTITADAGSWTGRIGD
jgi:hypothetical protein